MYGGKLFLIGSGGGGPSIVGGVFFSHLAGVVEGIVGVLMFAVWMRKYGWLFFHLERF